MKCYSALLEFIPYFKDDSITFCEWQNSSKQQDGSYTMPYPIYDAPVKEFIQAVYDSGIMMHDYMNEIHGQMGSHDDTIRLIRESGEMKMLRAILTYYVRQERFHDGLWAQAAEKKIFLEILLKLKGWLEQSDEKRENS